MSTYTHAFFILKPNISPSSILKFYFLIAMPYSNLLIVLTMALFRAAMTVNHEIGGAAGWTAAGTVDYTNWASTNNFQVGDQLDFKYNRQFHNVIEVSRQDYESCNSSSPILTYTTGHDSVELTSTGHHYFLCGNSGHCDAGQKLDIFVHCDADGGGAAADSPPYHHSSSPSFVNNDNSLFLQVVLLYFVYAFV